ncbi:MAG TPA: 4-vinyl reductase [Aquificaceae bacterium]|nr:4-vinyl reductase [Aquificaceae bacterium]HIQ48226.1 4-vinyl reductase [Aquifex aeolicus]
MVGIKDQIRALAEAIERESVLIHRDALIGAYRDLNKIAKFGLDKLIKKAAEFGGKKGAKTLKERYGIYTDRLDEALDVLSIIAESSRMIGYFEYDVDNLEIKVEGSILVEAIPQSEKPVCQPMAGFFKGFLSEFLEKEYDVEEVTCKSQGYDRCLFRIKPKGGKK